ncbi:hypothetical protein FHP29_12605 [Nocardioides albidus]|uniref:Uncharacterized protein n=1 Tax=Nocardioides albidus TaxID=1517589 RepID=A0A5C4VV97_9ACTN|nr:hypothetical protein FHP29_12605 [Nocardioides albidus]
MLPVRAVVGTVVGTVVAGAAGIRWIGTTLSRDTGRGKGDAGATTRDGVGWPGPSRSEERWIEVPMPDAVGRGTSVIGPGGWTWTVGPSARAEVPSCWTCPAPGISSGRTGSWRAPVGMSASVLDPV